MFPIGVLAAPVDPGDVEATKTATYNPETDEVTITLSVQGKDAEETVTEENPVDVVLVVDNSGSMDEGAMDCDSTSFHKYGLFGLRYQCDKCGTVYWEKPDACGGSISKMSAAKKAAYLLMDELGTASEKNRLALVGFTGSVGGEQVPNVWTELNKKACYSLNELVPNSEGVKGLMQAIFDMKADGGTNYTAGLAKAKSYLDLDDKEREKYVIFISDGVPGLFKDGVVIDYTNWPFWNGTEQAKDLKEKGVQIYTIGLGLENKTDALYRLASGEGYTYNLSNEEQINTELPKLVEEIATKISTVTKPAATGLTFTDKISKDFTWVEGQELPEGVTYNASNHTVTWEFDATTGEKQSVSFKVTPKDPTICGNNIATNGEAKLTYTKYDDTEGNIDVSPATVTIPSCTLSYNLAEGVAPEGCKEVFEDIAIRRNVTYTLPDCEPTREGHTFAGWKDTDGADYEAGASIIMSSDITLTAQWETTTQNVGINYWDVENNVQAGEGKVTVDKDATSVNTSALTDIPAGYELVRVGDFPIRDGWVYIEVKPVPATKEVGINYWDVENNTQAGEGKVTVDKDATSVNTSALTDIPAGYELVRVGDFPIRDGWVYIEVKPVPATKEVGINYWDVENNTQAGEGKVTVDKDATSVNTSALTDIPAGYELVRVGDFPIRDGWVYIEVKPIPATKEVGINYWDVENNTQAGEGKVTVDKDATSVNTSALTDIPAGYELVRVGDFPIRDGWVYIEVKPIPATKEVGINYWDVENNTQAGEGKVTVDKDATSVNTSALTDIPAGYELVRVGDFPIRDGWVYIEVKPIPATKEVGINYWDVENNTQAGEGKVTVDKDATSVNTSALTDIPAGYELVRVGDFPIRDGWVYIEVKPIEVSNTVIVNVRFMDGDEFIAGGDFFFEKDASVKFGDLELPEGYELDSEKNNAESGFVARDGAQIIVRVKKISTTGIMNIRFMDGETFVAGGDYFLPLGVQNYAVLAQYVPEGYRMCVAGDFMVTDGGKLDVPVEKIPTTGIMNIRFMDGDEFVAGGDYFLPLGVQNYSILTKYVPEGYRMCVAGDFMVTDGGKLDVPVEKIPTTGIMNIRFVEQSSDTFIAGGDYMLPLGVQNYSILNEYVPEGYQMCVSGDFMVTAGGKLDVPVEKIPTTGIMNIRFVEQSSDTFIAGGDYMLPLGVQNYSILTKYVPKGYQMCVSGDFMVTAGGKLDVPVEKIPTTGIMNIRFVEQSSGTFIAGGDYMLPLGVQNYSILNEHVPEGYQMCVSGDFMVTAGGKLDVPVEKIPTTGIMNIRFVEQSSGTFIAGGDYMLPLGVQNYSILTKYVPKGYQMCVSGDFMVTAGGKLDVPVEKIPTTGIMNIRFVEQSSGTFIAGGDYILPLGVQNYSILNEYVPEGYQMCVSGDFMVTAGGKLDVPVEKIPTHRYHEHPLC